jgi:hypothetical protein
MDHLRGVIQIKYTFKPGVLISGIESAAFSNLKAHGYTDSFFFDKITNRFEKSST